MAKWAFLQYVGVQKNSELRDMCKNEVISRCAFAERLYLYVYCISSVLQKVFTCECTIKGYWRHFVVDLICKDFLLLYHVVGKDIFVRLY